MQRVTSATVSLSNVTWLEARIICNITIHNTEIAVTRHVDANEISPIELFCCEFSF